MTVARKHIHLAGGNDDDENLLWAGEHIWVMQKFNDPKMRVWLDWRRLGYEEARTGTRYAYPERASKANQVSWEWGRSWVPLMRVEGEDPPAWRAMTLPDLREMLMKIPRHIWHETPCLHLNRQPDDPDLVFAPIGLDRRGVPLPVPTVCTC